ncbi:hypothetical protein RL72_03231 [Microbacterium azadirachtae]|uniref:Uncharacterized protein n=1 Tax=Microbacterium azadirachtae TaxID=582680 RepID=A0A0F0KFD9_9MICO|nr:hypothetical protein [Microbacterium azadirachtae]KJL19578.1 hypothetical protein RL72_03231 [Microbacterium azadirachtae]
MTNNTNARKREALSAAGLLWITSTGAVPMAAPAAFGGATWRQQLDDMNACAEQEGVTLGDDNLFCTHVPETLWASMRIVKLLEFVAQHPTRELFVPSSVFADLTLDDREVHISALETQGTQLMFCDE